MRVVKDDGRQARVGRYIERRIGARRTRTEPSIKMGPVFLRAFATSGEDTTVSYTAKVGMCIKCSHQRRGEWIKKLHDGGHVAQQMRCSEPPQIMPMARPIETAGTPVVFIYMLW